MRGVDATALFQQTCGKLHHIKSSLVLGIWSHCGALNMLEVAICWSARRLNIQVYFGIFGNVTIHAVKHVPKHSTQHRQF